MKIPIGIPIRFENGEKIPIGGGRWGLLESEKPNKKPIKTEKPQ